MVPDTPTNHVVSDEHGDELLLLYMQEISAHFVEIWPRNDDKLAPNIGHAHWTDFSIRWPPQDYGTKRVCNNMYTYMIDFLDFDRTLKEDQESDAML